MLEAKCQKCGETFNPDDVNDVLHIMREDGKFCGGLGHIEGEYQKPTGHDPKRCTLENPDPNCSDPDCEFAYPGTSTPPPTYEDMEAQAAYDDFWGRY
jgi:hypothetical protein